LNRSTSKLITRRVFAATFASLAATRLKVTAAQEEVTPVASPEPSTAPRFFLHPMDEAEYGYPELTLDPGRQGAFRAGVTVRGEEPVELTIYRADTVPTAGGGFAAAELDNQPTGHTLWMDIEPTPFPASPENTYEFTVAVTIPEDTTPGQYVTSLVVQTNPVEISGSATFNQIIRSALPVVINVPGELMPGMEIGSPEVFAQGNVRAIRIPVSNTGNVLIKPEGSVTMTTPDGEEVLTAPIEMKAIYLGLDNEIRVVIPNQVLLGEYLVSYDIHEPTYGLHAMMDDAPVTITEIAPEATPGSVTFLVDSVMVTASGDPIQFADVTATITNNGQGIPTSRVSLVAMRDGEEVETYDLAVNQAILQGESTINQRYIPASGWETGTWTFQLLVAAVDASGTETILAEVDVDEGIIVP
jgi:hypothetical protein